MEKILIEYHAYKVILTDNRIENSSIEHEFVNGDNELTYLGPMDICPGDIAEIIENETNKPVK